jgi:peptidoglycan/xylan/chitin deacetylase (PgdA/CDA1 family)
MNAADANALGFWPAAYAGAVTLTFDDGLTSQLDHAIPALTARGLRGTIYVVPGPSPFPRSVLVLDNLVRWRAAVRAGHEVGNHTTLHAGSINHAPFHPHFLTHNLESMGLEEIAATIDEAERRLDERLPEQAGRHTFAYPCYLSDVGAGAARQSFVPLVERRFAGARGGLGECANLPHRTDLGYVRSWSIEDGVTADAIIAKIEHGMRNGGWSVLTFHGVGGDYLTTSMKDFEGLLAYLDAQRERIWTDTLYGVASYVRRRRAELGAPGALAPA